MGMAVETNYRYRTVELGDIKAGAEAIMIDTDRRNGFDPSVDPAIIGTRIRFDEPAIQDEVVYYHCVGPELDGQCFVPLKQFLGEEKPIGVDNTTKYWVEREK